jgi:hypothetical protein
MYVGIHTILSNETHTNEATDGVIDDESQADALLLFQGKYAMSFAVDEVDW